MRHMFESLYYRYPPGLVFILWLILFFPRLIMLVVLLFVFPETNKLYLKLYDFFVFK